MSNLDYMECLNELQNSITQDYNNTKLFFDNIYHEMQENVKHVMENKDVRITNYLQLLYNKTKNNNEPYNYMFSVFVDDVLKSLKLLNDNSKDQNVHSNFNQAMKDVQIFLSEKI